MAVIQFGVMAGIAVVGGAFLAGAWARKKLEGRKVPLFDNIRPK